MIVSTSAIFLKTGRPANFFISANGNGIKGSLRVRPVGLPVSNTLFAPIHVQSQFIPLPESGYAPYPGQQGYILSGGYSGAYSGGYSGAYSGAGLRTLGNWKVPVVSSLQNVEIVSVPVQTQEHRTNVLTVEPTSQSVHLLFKSSSSPLSVQQQHFQSERPTIDTARTEEQPHIIRHEVLKPVIQELHETIQPFRHVTQEIKPVVEKISVVVPRGQPSFSGSSGIAGSIERPGSGSFSGSTGIAGSVDSSSSGTVVRPGLSLQSGQLQSGQSVQAVSTSQSGPGRFLFPYSGPFPVLRPVVVGGQFPVSYPVPYPPVFTQSQPVDYREPITQTQTSLPFNGYEQKESRERDSEYEQQNDEFDKS